MNNVPPRATGTDTYITYTHVRDEALLQRTGTTIYYVIWARSRATPRVRGGASNHGSWRKNVVNFHFTTTIYVVAIKSCKFWSRIMCSEIGITSFKSTPPYWESASLCTCDDVTMVDECKQSTTTPSTHVKKIFQVNTFHDGLKAWMDLCRHCVCLESYLKYVFSIYRAKYDDRIGECPWRSWRYLICIITRGLCSCIARLFYDDVTAIKVSFWRRILHKHQRPRLLTYIS